MNSLCVKNCKSNWYDGIRCFGNKERVLSASEECCFQRFFNIWTTKIAFNIWTSGKVELSPQVLLENIKTWECFLRYMMITKFLLLLFITVHSIKVLTNVDCEVATSSTRVRWPNTRYGYKGRRGSNEGKVFEFDCQTTNCRDSDNQRGSWWLNCG